MTRQVFSPEQARGAASSIKKKADNVRSLIDQLDKEIRSVSGWWEGQSATAFIDEFTEIKTNFLDKMVPCVENISINLNKVAEIKEDSENQIAQALRK